MSADESALIAVMFNKMSLHIASDKNNFPFCGPRKKNRFFMEDFIEGKSYSNT
jgi:hypothetical protein